MLISTRQEKRTREKTLKTVYTFQCDVCTKVFDTNINGKVRSRQKNHYCSQDCLRVSLKKGGIAQDNMRKTCVDKYGDETVWAHMNRTSNRKLAHTADAQDKRNQTMMDKYGYKTFRRYHSAIELDIKEALSVFNLCSGFVGRNQIDLIDRTRKIAIEVQGDFWHAHPELYSDDWIHPVSKLSAKEIREKDERKRLFLESKGYRVFYVWEKDYRNNRDQNHRRD